MLVEYRLLGKLEADKNCGGVWGGKNPPTRMRGLGGAPGGLSEHYLRVFCDPPEKSCWPGPRSAEDEKQHGPTHA